MSQCIISPYENPGPGAEMFSTCPITEVTG